jgi:hypothetical protein
MCPICISAVAVAAAGTGSTGGLAALVVARLRAKPRPTFHPHVPHVDPKIGAQPKTTEASHEK